MSSKEIQLSNNSLPGLDLVAARDGEIGERAAERRGHINVFALDITLKNLRRIWRTACNENHGQRQSTGQSCAVSQLHLVI